MTHARIVTSAGGTIAGGQAGPVADDGGKHAQENRRNHAGNPERWREDRLAATPGHGDRHDAQRQEDLQDDAHQETDGGNMSCDPCYRW